MTTSLRAHFETVVQSCITNCNIPRPLVASFNQDHHEEIQGIIEQSLGNTTALLVDRKKTVQAFIRTAYDKWDKRPPPSPSPGVSRGPSRCGSVTPTAVFPFHDISSRSPCSRSVWLSASPASVSRESSLAPSLYRGEPLQSNSRFGSVAPEEPPAVATPPASQPQEASSSTVTASYFSAVEKRLADFRQKQREEAAAKQGKPPVPIFRPRSRELQASIGTPATAVMQGRPKGGVKCPDMENVRTSHCGTFDQVFGSLKGTPLHERLEENQDLLRSAFCEAVSHETRVDSICGIFCNSDLILGTQCERTRECLRYLIETQCVAEREGCTDHNFILIMIAIIGKTNTRRLKLKNESTLSAKRGIVYRTDDIYHLMFCVAPHLVSKEKNGNVTRPLFMFKLTNPKRVSSWTLMRQIKDKRNETFSILHRSGFSFDDERNYKGVNGNIAKCREALIENRRQAVALAAIFTAGPT